MKYQRCSLIIIIVLDPRATSSNRTRDYITRLPGSGPPSPPRRRWRRRSRSSSKSTAIERWDKTSTIGIGESTIQSIAQIDVMKPCGCREPRRIVGTCGVAGLFQSSASAVSSFLQMKQVSFAPVLHVYLQPCINMRYSNGFHSRCGGVE